MHDFGYRKVSPAKQLLIQQVGFVNSRHFFQHRSCAKHWFKNLKNLTNERKKINRICFQIADLVCLLIKAFCRYYKLDSTFQWNFLPSKIFHILTVKMSAILWVVYVIFKEHFLHFEECLAGQQRVWPCLMLRANSQNL